MKAVVFSHNFEKQTEKIPRKIYETFRERLVIFHENPFYPLLENHPLRGRYVGKRSINVTGDYRAIFEEKDDSIIFIAIGRHRELYE